MTLKGDTITHYCLMTTIMEKWRQAELCGTKGWHCHLHAAPAVPTTHRDTAPPTGVWVWSQGAVCSGCSQAHFILWQLHCSQIKFSSTFHHKLRVQILLSGSPTVVHSNTTFSSLWWETSNPEPTREHQELGEWLLGPHRTCPKEKVKAKLEAVCVSPKWMTLEIAEALPAPWAACGGWWVPSVLATATQQARKSKQKPPLPPQGQIWLEKQH